MVHLRGRQVDLCKFLTTQGYIVRLRLKKKKFIDVQI